MSIVTFEYTDRRGRRRKRVVSAGDSRIVAIQLAEDQLFDKIGNVTYTITKEDGTTETKELDYFNDIL